MRDRLTPQGEPSRHIKSIGVLSLLEHDCEHTETSGLHEAGEHHLAPRPELKLCALEPDPATANVQQRLGVGARNLGPLLRRANRSIGVG